MTLTDIVSMESSSSRASYQSQFSNQVTPPPHTPTHRLILTLTQVVQLGVLHLLTELLEKYTEILEIQVHVFSSIEHICVLPDIEVH